MPRAQVQKHSVSRRAKRRVMHKRRYSRARKLFGRKLEGGVRVKVRVKVEPSEKLNKARQRILGDIAEVARRKQAIVIERNIKPASDIEVMKLIPLPKKYCGPVQNEVHGSNVSSQAKSQWKPFLSMYTTKEMISLKFTSGKDIDEAISRLFSDELREMPYDIPGGYTLIVPRNSVPYFAGLSFKASNVLSPEDVSPAELAELRCQGTF